MKTAALAGFVGYGLSSSAAASSGYTEYDDEYRSVVDVVAAGADNTGEESITPVLNSVRGDDTLVYFPPGRYYMDSQFRFTNYDNFGVVGEDATIVPANYHDFDGPRFRLFRLGTTTNPGKRLRFERLTIDQTAPETGIRAIDANVTDHLDVRDILVRGEHDSGTWGPGRFNVVDPHGTGRVVDFFAPYGGKWAKRTPHAGKTGSRGPVGIISNSNEGSLMFRRCRLGQFPGCGLYACNGSGQIIVHGGYYENSNTASIRIGGKNSIARWPTIVVDETRPDNTSQRGIRIERGEARIEGALIRIDSPASNNHAITVMNDCTSAWIENTTIEMTGDHVNHGIVVSPKASDTVIVDTDITHNAAGGYPIWIRDSTSRERVLCEFVRIDGRAGDAGGLRDGIRCGRDNCRFNVCDVDQRGRNGTRRNAFVNTGDDSTVYRGTFRASQYPFVDLGNETLYLQADGESYDEGREAICLYSGTQNISLRGNRLVDGVKDYGTSALLSRSNTFE